MRAFLRALTFPLPLTSDMMNEWEVVSTNNRRSETFSLPPQVSESRKDGEGLGDAETPLHTNVVRHDLGSWEQISNNVMSHDVVRNFMRRSFRRPRCG